ncbi:MAG: ParA family partition ATPase [Pseudomonadota bacterium]
MAGKVFNIAQQKGGAGKTTVATHLAVAWAERRGRKVAVLDVDPQGSLTVWYEAREHYLGEENTGLTFRSAKGIRAMAEAQALAKDHDIVVVDMPPHGTTSANAAIRAATLVVAPVQPTPLDFWATMPTLEVAEAEKKPVVLVLNRVPPRALLTAHMITRLGQYKVRVAKASLGNRVAFAESIGGGRTVLETKARSVAAEEVRKLATELLRRA